MTTSDSGRILNSITTAVAGLLLLMIGPVQHTQERLFFFKAAEAGEVTCIEYDETENTIAVNCSASFLDLVQAINDPDVIEFVGNGEYILKANLEVADGVTFAMASSKDGLQDLKIVGANGIIVYGKILIDGIRITSWNIEDRDRINSKSLYQFSRKRGWTCSKFRDFPSRIYRVRAKRI
jgi:hypothetical protein